MPLEEGLAELDSLRPREKFSYQALARKHGCCRLTLSRQHQGRVVSHKQKAEDQRILHPRDKAELVQYIRGLTERHLMPTRQMIVNFTTPLARWEPSDRWVTRLLYHHPDELLTAWSTPMEAVRHHADTHDKYSQYFTLLHHKIAERDILPENTYNMDEKGFMVGVSGRSVRVFDKLLYGLRQYKQSTYDGNWAWVTLVACICADRSHLPPGVIFEAAGHEVQAS